MKKRTHRLILILCSAVLVGLVGFFGWFIYDTTVDRSGWLEVKGQYYYLDFHARKLGGWLTIDGSNYYFGEDKAMVTGWQEIGGKRYLFAPTGQMQTGWVHEEDGTRYLGPDGAMVNGWEEVDEHRYYFQQDGRMQTGWLNDNGTRYYFDEDGILCTGWLEIDGGRYFLQSGGAAATGKQFIDNTNYFFLDDGSLFHGWIDLADGRHYYLPDGPMATMWHEIDGKHYYFGDDGILFAGGWLVLGEYRYYILEDGSAAVGPHEIDGRVHYFAPMGAEVVLVNTEHPVADDYDPDLVPLFNSPGISAVAKEPLMKMLNDCQAAGIEYTFNSAYRSLTDQQEILTLRTKEYEDAGMDSGAAYAKARQTVALPGHSEHHLGLAVDILGSEAMAWLTEHCWEYGFILRYTAEKQPITGYVAEPWHFRYVGTLVSLDMQHSGLCLEEYLNAVPTE